MTLILSFCLFVAMTVFVTPASAAGRVLAPVELSGERQVIVLLAQFKNLTFTYSREDFEQMLCQKGYSRGGSLGSVEEYLNAQFAGKCVFSFDVAPIVTLGHDYSYYGINDPFGKDLRPAQAAYDACSLSDSDVDFSKYDDVIIYYAGGNPADGSADSEHIWPHNWFLSEEKLSLTLDGVKIDRYAMVPELVSDGNGGTVMAGMGLLCHEYAHTLGLVDMYDTDGAESGGVGAALLKTTSLMDQGMFNACGCLPPNFNAIELEMLGIAEAEELTVGVHILPPIGSKKKFYRLDTPLEGEYFLFECRKEDGWDKASGYQGLFAYHIDKSANDAGYGKTAAQRWQSLTPTVNANKNHQCAYLKVLSNSFTPVSDPAFVSWNGTPSPLCIDDIKVLKDGSVSFNVVAPLYVESKAVFQDALILKWNDISCTGSKCYVRWKDENGLEHTIDVDPYEVGKYSHTFEGLSPETEYVFAIYQLEGYDYTSVQVVTWPYGGRPFIYLPEVGRNASGSFQYGAELPLRVVNAPDLESVEWYFNDASISVSGNGYWKVTSSGTLKAVLTYLDGGDEVIEKRLKVE